MVVARGWGGWQAEHGSSCLTGTEFQFSKTKRVLGIDGDDSYPSTWMSSMPLNSTPEHGKDGKFDVVYVLTVRNKTKDKTNKIFKSVATSSLDNQSKSLKTEHSMHPKPKPAWEVNVDKVQELQLYKRNNEHLKCSPCFYALCMYLYFSSFEAKEKIASSSLWSIKVQGGTG